MGIFDRSSSSTSWDLTPWSAAAAAIAAAQLEHVAARSAIASSSSERLVRVFRYDWRLELWLLAGVRARDARAGDRRLRSG